MNPKTVGPLRRIPTQTNPVPMFKARSKLELDFCPSLDELKEFEKFAIIKGLEAVADGLPITKAVDWIETHYGYIVGAWRYDQFKKGPNYRIGALAMRAFNDGAEDQNIAPVPPNYDGREEYAPGNANDDAAIRTAMVGWLIPMLADVIDADFAPASGIRAARNALEALRAIRRGEGANEYGLLADSFMNAVQRAPFGFREADLKRAAELAIENLRIMLGATDQAPRDLSAKSFVELVAGRDPLTNSDNVFARHKNTPKTPAQSGSLVERCRMPIPIKIGERKGRNGKLSIRQAVLNTMGLRTESQVAEDQGLMDYHFIYPEPVVARASQNLDRNPLIKAIKLAGGSSIWVTPDGRQFPTYGQAEKWLAELERKEAIPA